MHFNFLQKIASLNTPVQSIRGIGILSAATYLRCWNAAGMKVLHQAILRCRAAGYKTGDIKCSDLF